MKNRTTPLFAALVLLLLAGAAAAQSAVHANATTETPPRERPAAAAFGAHLSPREIKADPGATVVFRLHAESREGAALTLRVRAPDGVAAELSRTELALGAGERASANLTVRVPDDARTGPIPLQVEVVGAGVARPLRATVQVAGDVEAPAEPSAPRAPPMRPGEDERMERLLDRLEQRIQRLERATSPERPAPLREARPFRADAVAHARVTVETPREAPVVHEGIRALLSEPHATLGPEGGRVALLLEAGNRPVSLALSVRPDAESGWRMGLEKTRVELPAHARGWILLHLDPAGGAQGARYLVEVAEEAPEGDVRVLQGTARAARMP